MLLKFLNRECVQAGCARACVDFRGNPGYAEARQADALAPTDQYWIMVIFLHVLPFYDVWRRLGDFQQFCACCKRFRT